MPNLCMRDPPFIPIVYIANDNIIIIQWWEGGRDKYIDCGGAKFGVVISYIYNYIYNILIITTR